MSDEKEEEGGEYEYVATVSNSRLLCFWSLPPPPSLLHTHSCRADNKEQGLQPGMEDGGISQDNKQALAPHLPPPPPRMYRSGLNHKLSATLQRRNCFSETGKTRNSVLKILQGGDDDEWWSPLVNPRCRGSITSLKISRWWLWFWWRWWWWWWWQWWWFFPRVPSAERINTLPQSLSCCPLTPLSPPIHSQVNVSSHTFLHVHCTMCINKALCEGNSSIFFWKALGFIVCHLKISLSPVCLFVCLFLSFLRFSDVSMSARG